jgi:hypothetical protein
LGHPEKLYGRHVRIQKWKSEVRSQKVAISSSDLPGMVAPLDFLLNSDFCLLNSDLLKLIHFFGSRRVYVQEADYDATLFIYNGET